MKNTIFYTYLGFGLCVCLWFTVAAAMGWRAPNLGILDGMAAGGGSGSYGSGRSYGGSWGGGK